VRRISVTAIAAVIMSFACNSRKPDFAVRGVAVVLDTTAPFAHRADFPARLESTIDAALQFWHGDWAALEGTTLVLEDDQYVACQGSTSHALGCSVPGEIHITTRDPDLSTWLCVEQSVLVHEIGHAAIGDRNHDDARWMDFVPVFDSLEGREGYTETGVTSCPLYINVWRHRLHSQ
jgi:hypothetical protein